MRFPSVAGFLLSFCLCVSTVALGQANQDRLRGGPFRGGQGSGAAQGRFYDPKTVETLTGEVLNLDKVAGAVGTAGIHANLKADKGESISVHLGPAWYLDLQAVTVKPGDKVTVRGSRIVFDGKPAIIAAELTKEGQTLRLRDDNGVPAWAGGRRRGR